MMELFGNMISLKNLIHGVKKIDSEKYQMYILVKKMKDLGITQSLRTAPWDITKK